MTDYQYDLFVIGAGSGGVRAARMASAQGLKVAIAEERYLGGTCVNVGCVPKKLFSYAAHFHRDFSDAAGFGWSVDGSRFDWPTLRDNKTREIERLNGIYARLLDNAGTTLIRGHAEFVDAHTVAVDGQHYTARSILIAVGGWPFIPSFPGSEHVVSSNEIFYLEKLPARAVVVGGGYIACEFASILNGLGVKTRQLYRRDLFLRGFDTEIRQRLADEVSQHGVELHFNTDVSRIDKQADGSMLITLNSGDTLEADLVLYATGRKPLLENLGLEKLNVEVNEQGYIRVDEYFETTEPGVYALGDVTGGLELTPVALAEGMALVHNLLHPQQRKSVDYHFVPTAIFSHPNVATVGYSEEKARELFGEIRVYSSHFRHLKHTLTDNPSKVFLKLIVDVASDKVVGAHMLGDDAGEIIQGLAVAMKAGATKADFDSTIGIHPTVAEEFVTLREAVR